MRPRLDEQTRDTILLRDIARGDRDALSEFFRRRRADVYRFAVHMTGCRATAEDVTQDVFLAVIRDAGRYEPTRASVVAWLFGITRNHVRRRLDDRLVPLPAQLDDTAPRAPEPDPAGLFDHAERIATVRQAVVALPSRYREVVVLCDLQEVSYADAAAAIGCAIGTVRSRLHRGRALIAAALRRDESVAPAPKIRRSRCFA